MSNLSLLERVQDPFVMVTSTTQAKSIYGIAESTGRVALDCEGCSLSRAGQLCLVQVNVQLTLPCTFCTDHAL